MNKVLIPLAISTFPMGATVPVDFVRETYLKKLLAHDLEPVLVSPLFPHEIVDRIYGECGGVLVTGGPDYDPAYYGAKKDPQTKIGERARDELEITVLKKALADRKPILAICRGEQGLAIAAGGTLHQHLPDVFPNESHAPSAEKEYDDLILPQNGHDVLIERGSRTFALVGKERITVNSYHHQAVDDPGKDMRVAGKSPAGVVEIIEHVDPDYFCFGIQSHPECCGAEYPGGRPMGDLEPFFGAFAAAAQSKPVLN